MDNEFSSETQHEIEEIKNNIEVWKPLFDIKIDLYFDGWAIFLREKNL